MFTERLFGPKFVFFVHDFAAHIVVSKMGFFDFGASAVLELSKIIINKFEARLVYKEYLSKDLIS
jgi:hypothetical protein